MNNIMESTNYAVIQQVASILEKAITEEESNTTERVVREIRDLLDSVQTTEVDTHGLIIHGLDEAARATAEAAQPGWFNRWCNIYYDRDLQKVSAEICLIGNKPSILNQLSTACSYVCTSIRPMTQQEIADKVFAMVNRNIELALVAEKYNVSEALNEAMMVLSRWKTFVS